ncbi:MAG: hypothetical protein U5L09_06745 [Bacteroidales bacterium]|nr:hypothetical protein [Bacteroidales bacterium]
MGHGAARWAGYSKNKSIWIGGATGFMYQTVIEILDGFSAEWGASPGDIAANTLGSALFIAQQKMWEEQRIKIKSIVPPHKLRPLPARFTGTNEMESVLKDYNGHTFWISGNLKRLTKSNALPPWLSLAAGYNAYGMTGASGNSTSYQKSPIPPFERRWRLLLAPDVDWIQIQSGSGFMKILLQGLSFIKAPTPALEYSKQGGLKIRLLFF